MEPHYTEYVSIYPCAKGFFIVSFANLEERKAIKESNPFFWGNSGLFLKTWSSSFNPSIYTISITPIWVRLPKLPLHLWNLNSLKSIGNIMCRFLGNNKDTKEYLKTTNKKRCVEMDFTKGFPVDIIMTNDDYYWVQNMDYENLLFWCLACHEMDYLAKKFPKSNHHSSSRSMCITTWWDKEKEENSMVYKKE